MHHKPLAEEFLSILFAKRLWWTMDMAPVTVYKTHIQDDELRSDSGVIHRA